MTRDERQDLIMRGEYTALRSAVPPHLGYTQRPSMLCNTLVAGIGSLVFMAVMALVFMAFTN